MNKKKYVLNPSWVTGFVDGEGCFSVYLARRKDRKSGWHIQVCFQIALHIKDIDLLLQIKSFFREVGTILVNKNRNCVYYKIRKLNDIIKMIIPHFDKYPLITYKQKDFKIFKNIVELMSKGEHLYDNGIIKIISLKAFLNKGLSNKLNIYSNLIKFNKVKMNIPNIIDYNWICGFFTAEACFFINIYKAKKLKTGYGITLQIIIGQHIRDKLLLNNIKNTLGCGTISERINKNMMILTISKFADIFKKVIPLINEYKIEGIKSLDFQDFCKTGELINKKIHLTLEGLEEIRKIKSGMNRNRLYNI